VKQLKERFEKSIKELLEKPAGSAVVSIDIKKEACPARWRFLASSVRIDVSVEATDQAAADAIGARLTVGNINAELKEHNVHTHKVLAIANNVSLPQWVKAAEKKPTGGFGKENSDCDFNESSTEFENDELAEVLGYMAASTEWCTLQLEEELWTAFGDKVSSDCYIKVGDRYFRPRQSGEKKKEWEALYHQQQLDPKTLRGAHRVEYSDGITELSDVIRELLKSDKFVFFNVHSSMEVGDKILTKIVRLDRLPQKNSLEGLRLLKEAWCEYDVAMMLATWYKTLSKVLFAMKLLVGWLIVVAGALGQTQGSILASIRVDEFFESREMSIQLEDIMFGLSVLATLLISIDAIFNAKARWRLLRTSAGTLESHIYQYRARVGQFELKFADPDSNYPEIALRDCLIQWRSATVAGGDLQLSSFKQSYLNKHYKHGQYEKKPASKLGSRNWWPTVQTRGSKEKSDDMKGLGSETDDYHTPVQPDLYIKIRLEKWLSFYRQRIPYYARARDVYNGILVILAAAASVLTAYGEASLALLVTSAAAMLTSWIEFVDVGHKTERYTRAIVDLENLLSHWKSLSEAEKASPTTVAFLVQSGESIIAGERIAWQSTAAQTKQQNGDGRAGERTPGTGNEGAAGGGTSGAKSLRSSKSKVHPSS